MTKRHETHPTTRRHGYGSTRHWIDDGLTVGASRYATHVAEAPSRAEPSQSEACWPVAPSWQPTAFGGAYATHRWWGEDKNHRRTSLNESAPQSF